MVKINGNRVVNESHSVIHNKGAMVTLSGTWNNYILWSRLVNEPAVFELYDYDAQVFEKDCYIENVSIDIGRYRNHEIILTVKFV